MGFVWNKESIEVATRMWSTGSSAGKIAEYFGIGRGAVIGKLSRLGVMRDPNRKTRDKLERGTSPKAAAVRRPAPPVPEPEPLHLTLFELARSGQCRWPYGDSPFTFCGHPASAEKPYCEHHTQKSMFTKENP